MTADAMVQKLDQVQQPILRRIKRGLPESHASHAEDLYQEVALAVVSQADRFDWKGDDRFYSWVYRVVDSVIATWWRFHTRQKRDIGQSTTPPDEVAAPDPTPVVQTSRRERGEVLIAAARELLGERDAQLLQLYFIEEQTAEEVGQNLGLSAAGVRQTAKRAIQVLRESLRASAFLTQR